MIARTVLLFGALAIGYATYAQTPAPAKSRSRSFSLGPDPVVVLDSISTLIKAHPDSVELYRDRAEKIYRYTLSRGDGEGDKYRRDGVFADMDKAIAMRPSDAGLWVARGNYRWDILQDTTAAMTDMGKAIEMDPKNPRWYDARAVVFVQMGDHDSACTDFTSGAALDDDRCRKGMMSHCRKK